jgi:FAD/FMN-containing dehydrogenase
VSITGQPKERCVKIMTPDGHEGDLDSRAIDALRARLHGPLLAAGDAGYDEARALWNGMIDRRPALIAKCLGTADVMAGVTFAREHGLVLSIKSGGHNIAGLALCDGGLTLDLSAMRGVWVDPAARTARAQGGCLLGDVDRETQIHGLAAVLGFVSMTGIAGLTVGGGFGYLTRRFGWTCDTVRSMDVVTADGRLVHASATEHPDLFWALRGGGGNFGVVVNIEYDLYPVGPGIVGGAIAWPIEEAPDVVDRYQRLFADAPPELTVVLGMRKAPPAPWLAPSIHGKHVVALFVCHTGDVTEGERLLAPLKTLGHPVGDILQRRSYVSQQALLDATQPKGRRYYWKSEYMADPTREYFDTVRAHAEKLPSPHSALLTFPLGGALNTLPRDASPMGNRDAQYVFNIAGAWDKAADDEANIAWVRGAWQDLRRFSTGGTYVNFLTEDEDADRTRTAYGEHYARLAAVKARWDPTNLFRVNKNIAPAGV